MRRHNSDQDYPPYRLGQNRRGDATCAEAITVSECGRGRVPAVFWVTRSPLVESDVPRVGYGYDGYAQHPR